MRATPRHALERVPVELGAVLRHPLSRQPGGYKQAELFGRAVFPRPRVERLSATLSLFERAADR